MENFKDKVLGALKNVVDPELGINIVDLGLVYAISNEGPDIQISMTATTPFCPYLPQLIEQVASASKSVSGVKTAKVEIVWTPAWSPEKLSDEAKAQLGIL